jgi:hypothetical protein
MDRCSSGRAPRRVSASQGRSPDGHRRVAWRCGPRTGHAVRTRPYRRVARPGPSLRRGPARASHQPLRPTRSRRIAGRSVRFQSANPRDLAVKDGGCRRLPTTAKTAHLQECPATQRRLRLCLPCRRSWVRIPSAASEKACIYRSFSCAQLAGAFASRRTETGPAAKPPCIRLEESGCLQGILDRSNC